MEPSDSGLRPSPQGEEGPPSLEYIQAKDLFPPKELVKEEENLQVRKSWGPRVARALCLVKKNTLPSPGPSISKGMECGSSGFLPLSLWRAGSLSVCASWSLWPQGREGSFPV